MKLFFLLAIQIERKKKLKICMKLQKTSNNQNNPENEQQS